MDLVFILINWLLFVAMVVCLHYRIFAGLFAAFLVYSLMVYGEWQSVMRGRNPHQGF